MANWGNLKSRGSIDDRRAFGASGRIGGIGIGGLALVLLFNYLNTGTIDVGSVLSTLQNQQVVQQNIDPKAFEGADEYETFTSTVFGSTTDMWSSVFTQAGQTYTPPHFVLFRGSTTSSCGGASASVGPHYCPGDETIYLDETFFDELQHRFGGGSGDVAQAYVIAHEVGHHVQNELQLENDSSVATELQADCFAGLWASSLKDQGVFEPGEIKEAIDAAAAVGDDNIQKRTSGYVNSETWTHGSSAERVSAFNKGYESGAFSTCVQ
jgi:uncharacterized protein